MKKGFTLIELLAIIIILGLIIVITVPKIKDTIDTSQKNIYTASVKSLIEIGENFYITKKSNQEIMNGCTYNFTTNANTCNGIEFKGEKPEKGILEIDKEGKIAIAVKFNNYCYTKNKETDKITIENYNEETCINEE